MQAKVKEPELYELHDRVKQIRKKMNNSQSGTKLATQKDMIRNGAATQ